MDATCGNDEAVILRYLDMCVSSCRWLGKHLTITPKCLVERGGRLGLEAERRSEENSNASVGASHRP